MVMGLSKEIRQGKRYLQTANAKIHQLDVPTNNQPADLDFHQGNH
jgi:hypothetical protein